MRDEQYLCLSRGQSTDAAAQDSRMIKIALVSAQQFIEKSQEITATTEQGDRYAGISIISLEEQRLRKEPGR
jgi:hypothetical protein